MIIQTNARTATPAEPLRFACTCCGGALEVPQVLAGVKGPCPLCGELTVAPGRPHTTAPRISARAFAKPPPRRELPPPLDPIADSNKPALTVLRPIPIVDEPAPALLPPAKSEHRSFPVRPLPLPPEIAGEVPERPVRELKLFPQPAKSERGVFDATAASHTHLLDIKSLPPALPRHSWRRWVDIGIVSVFTGVLLATIAALRYTVPVPQKSAPGLPPNLTQLVERESKQQEMREKEAGELACAAVRRYLGAGSEQAAASHLLPPPAGVAAPSFPPFSTQLPAAWVPASTRRIPLTERYLVCVQPGDGTGPVFLVEQTENGPRLHAGPITQQSAGLFEKFTATPGQGEASLYVEVRPTTPRDEQSYRTARPDLAGFRLVDVMPAFPCPSPAFIACFKPDSEAARQFARRAHDPGWRRALVQVRWQTHREAGPWAELVTFLPGSWSGDPPATTPAATASTGP